MRNGGPCKHGVRFPNPCEQCGADWRLSALNCSALLNALIENTSEDAVFTMLTAISVFGIENREQAMLVLREDQDCAEWLEYTMKRIVGPWQNDQDKERL